MMYTPLFSHSVESRGVTIKFIRYDQVCGVGVICPLIGIGFGLSENLGGTMVTLVSPFFVYYAPVLECSLL